MSGHNQVDNAGAAGFTAAIDLDNVPAGTKFQATWTFTNTGTTTWDNRYHFAYTPAAHPETTAFPRSPMAEETSFPITEIGAPAAVPPGATVRLTVPFAAPANPATHATNWQLRSPNGRRFGPTRWMRAVVREAAPLPPEDKPEPEPPKEEPPKEEPPKVEAPQFAPELWRSAIWALTSIFESGVAGGRVDAFQNADAGIVSFGKHQATLQSGNLERVLNAYFQRSQSETSAALRQEFAGRVQRKEESLRNDARFKQLLLAAAREPAMSEAQDEIFETNFYRPIIQRAIQLGVRTPLGLACLYDTRIQGGLDIVLTAVAQRLGSSAVDETGKDGRPITEPTWIRVFLEEREAWLNRLADRREAEGRRTDAQFLRVSTFRAVELRRLLEANNLELAGEFVVRGQRIQGIRREAAERLAEKLAKRREPPDEAEKPKTFDLLPYIKGDGRQYELLNARGSQERLQTQEEGDNFYQVKNAQWEQFFQDNQFIYRDADTSPGANRFYRLRDLDLARGSRWLRRQMAVGDTHTQTRRVQFFHKGDGSPSAENSGQVTDTIKLVAHHSKFKFRTGIELEDVVELEWVNGGEKYYYARNYGLVGWERKHQDPHTPAWSAISEIHRPGAREPFTRERVPL